MGINLEIVEVENGWAIFKDTYANDRGYLKPIYVATTLDGLLEIIRKQYEKTNPAIGEVFNK